MKNCACGSGRLLVASYAAMSLIATTVTAAPSDQPLATTKCASAGDYNCEEQALAENKARSTNQPNVHARLGISQYRQGRYDEAIANFQTAINSGLRSAEIYALYADSLGKLGKTGEAIDWGYRAVKLAPKSMEARSRLSQLLMQEGRYTEALTLLVQVDDKRTATGEVPLFQAERKIIQHKLNEKKSSVPSQSSEIRLAKLGRHFVAPLQLGSADYVLAVVDTGASKTVFPRNSIETSGAVFVVKKPDRKVRLADGTTVEMDLVTIDTLVFGDLVLRQVDVFVCKVCTPLLGQNVLSLFDMKSFVVQDIEFLSLTLRREPQSAAREVTTVKRQQASADPEAEAWRAADSANTAAGYRMYLEAYGDQGRYAVAAKIRLNALLKN